MKSGANYVQKQLRTELKNYIESQYLGKSPILLNAVREQLDQEGCLYQKPYIESSPAYQIVNTGFRDAKILPWMKDFFEELAKANIGVYNTPYVHQINALEAAMDGKDAFVSTGTGSGKTECFMWPLVGKLAKEAKTDKASWNQRGVRTIIMYPMNALVSDQLSRLRKMLGDSEHKFVNIFRDFCGSDVRRPQFGMYTGRTPYPGEKPNKSQDSQLKSTLKKLSLPKGKNEYFDKLLKEGKIPAKDDMQTFLNNLENGRHIPNSEDAELITRFEMQQFCPDILITNYSMLEYMLLRPREQHIWDETRAWLNQNSENKILFVIDEAHMYRGSSGGEVALLIRRLFHKLGISRDRVQFILTTASMPENKDEKVRTFAKDLTAATQDNFCYLKGSTEQLQETEKYNIPFSKFENTEAESFENDETCLKALNHFWKDIQNTKAPFDTLESACQWMYTHLIEYKPFFELIHECRGNAVSLGELAEHIFPEEQIEDALDAVSILLAIAPLARNEKGSVLFPARMHMLFKGITGVYACTNPNCPYAHTDGNLTLGEIFLSNGDLSCPHCHSAVYELYNDRRCGALFFKGYILNNNAKMPDIAYLWHYPGQLIDKNMREIHLYIPGKDFSLKKSKRQHSILPCYMDVKSGFINFKDDSLEGQPNIRKLYYCEFSENGRPDLQTFYTCPHCEHQMSQTQLTSFSTKGNQSFYSLIRSQFQLQAPVPGKDKDPKHLPNQGRKVLLFSDSRQGAAKLARDMSNYSSVAAAKQIFVRAIQLMEESKTEYSLDDLYDYFCLEVAKGQIQIFDGDDQQILMSNVSSAEKFYERCKTRKKDYKPRFKISSSPQKMQEYFLRFFAGGYNTLYDSAISWLEPMDDVLEDAIDSLEDEGITTTPEEVLEVFNAWMLYICDKATALGQTISDGVREKVRRKYGSYGITCTTDFPTLIRKGMNLSKEKAETWNRIFKSNFLNNPTSDPNTLYVDLSTVKPRLDMDHDWYCCEKCSGLTPFLLNQACPVCGSTDIHLMSDEDKASLDYWRKPLFDALSGQKIFSMNTAEHTAQISHKDQRNDLWSQTEKYELRFQDLLEENETPVDILSSTTTMEVGIDIGSLVAVGLRNIPPMRENYQQRAGRAGRRGSSLSTIITFCENGPHDTLYFKNPVPMFRGEPRTPWIDINSIKLLQRHLTIIIFQDFLKEQGTSIDVISTIEFFKEHFSQFEKFCDEYHLTDKNVLLPVDADLDYSQFIKHLTDDLKNLAEKCKKHPELYEAKTFGTKNKTLLDALYEEGIIPTYSFPKNVVSTYIGDKDGKPKYEVDRGLDIAIGEYAPGRAIVVDKETYQIGGLYVPGSEYGSWKNPATKYVEDANYLKAILKCSHCGWFGLASDEIKACPFCGNAALTFARPMLRPWGFAPKNAKSTEEAQLEEEYSAVQQPLYSTLPEADEMRPVKNTKNIRVASRTNQRIIMVNKGVSDRGFMVCKECGAAVPGDNEEDLNNVERPYVSKLPVSKCKHREVLNVDLGYDFVTDMLVLEFALDSNQINVSQEKNPWIFRAAQSLAEALRLAACKILDVEFTELVTGYRLRKNIDCTFIDIYIYDSLSSGAGYAVSVADQLEDLITEIHSILKCTCDNACYECLKHYRNQNIHGMLDRNCALNLLEWGEKGHLADVLPLGVQKKLILPLYNILKKYNCELISDGQAIYVKKENVQKKLVIYPAMWKEPYQEDVIYISDAYLKYAKPYAVNKILKAL